ncbi:MAG: PEP-CTERM sorting domain-containing protein [Thermodesulfobacteriota bacterium]|nr:PEP-CTERM sorting domain-containing protein [Thermodesulfobacteriota bacterium]
MKRLLILVFVAALVLGLVEMAGAYAFDMGGDSWVDTSGTTGVLGMHAAVNPTLDNQLFSLDPGESHRFFYATLGTTESWINSDDINPGSLTAHIDFDNPDLTQAIGGLSVGFSAYWGFKQGWNLTWQDPVIIDFGTGGQFAIELSDVGYQTWWWQGPDGSADVWATVTLCSEPESVQTRVEPGDGAFVPEPSTILLVGTGLVGLAGLGRHRLGRR